jgi:hypothetical protein
VIERRAYGKVYRTFWTDPEICRLTQGQRYLLIYYYSSPSGNMIGLYHSPFAITAQTTGMRIETVKRWTLGELRRWVSYDLATNEVLVHNAARVALEANLHGGDKRRKAVERLLGAAHSTKLRRLFLHLYADWGLQVADTTKEGSPLEGPSEDLGSPTGSSSRSSSRSRSRSKTTSVATQPAAPSGSHTTGLSDGELMGLVRKHLYVPDGKAPAGYNDGRDVKIIRDLRKQGLSSYQIADAIEGVRILCDRGELGKKSPGDKLTMRALYNTGHGVRPLLYLAQEVVHKLAAQTRDGGLRFVDNRPTKPEHIGATLERLVPTRPAT